MTQLDSMVLIICTNFDLWITSTFVFSISIEELFDVTELPTGKDSVDIALKNFYIQNNLIEIIPLNLLQAFNNLEILQASRNLLNEIPDLTGMKTNFVTSGIPKKNFS